MEGTELAFGGSRMQENFRQFLDRLREQNELIDLEQPIDIRHIATLVDQSSATTCPSFPALSARASAR
jgi:hypothetical protein